MVHYEVYANSVKVDHEKNKLNRNVYNTVRRSFYYKNFYK